MPVSESVKPVVSTSEAEKHKHLNREVRDMVSIITSRLTNIHHKEGHGGQGQEDIGDDDDGDDNGVRIITLAGTNTGATLQGELDDGKAAAGDKSKGPGETEALKTYVNSNFQAVNNSIMMGGSYSANDPGVQVEISDSAESEKGFETGQKVSWKKGKKKNNKTSKSDGSSSASTTSGSESSD